MSSHTPLLSPQQRAARRGCPHKTGCARNSGRSIHHRGAGRRARLRDVQEAASHADPRTTMRYGKARASLDRHATYIVAAYVVGAAR